MATKDKEEARELTQGPEPMTDMCDTLIQSLCCMLSLP